MGVWKQARPGFEDLLAYRESLFKLGAKSGLRVALLLTAGWLVYWIEGAEKAVNGGWMVVSSDPRHDRLRLIHRSHGVATLNSPVEVVHMDSHERAVDVWERLQWVESADSSRKPPKEMFSQLAFPATCVAHFHEPDRLVAVLSEGHQSADLLDAVADIHRVRPRYHKFAGADPRTGSALTAYVDIEGANGWSRVIATSNAALHVDLISRWLGDADVTFTLPPAPTASGFREKRHGQEKGVVLLDGSPESLIEAVRSLDRVKHIYW